MSTLYEGSIRQFKPVHSIVLDNAISRLVESLKCLPKKVKTKSTGYFYHNFGGVRVVQCNLNTVCVYCNSDDDTDEEDNDDYNDPPYNGLPGYYWGGHGSCFKCGKCVPHVLRLLLFFVQEILSTGPMVAPMSGNCIPMISQYTVIMIVR